MGEAWPVLYVEDVDRAAEAARLTPNQAGSFGMRVTLIPFDGVSELGRIEIGGIAVAARDQVILDAYGGIDRMPEQATWRRWRQCGWKRRRTPGGTPGLRGRD